MTRVAVGIITYNQNTAKYLPYFLDALNAQTFAGFSLLAFDNSDDGTSVNRDLIAANSIVTNIYSAGENVGFARAYNRMIAKAIEQGAEYFLALNVDLILEADALEQLVAALDGDAALGSVVPKLYRWDFEGQRKTRVIDSCGLGIMPGLRFFDIGQGAEDKGQFDGMSIIGASGAAALYRLSALRRIMEGGQFFDERMFMYKEDCDLAYRLFLAGYGAKCVCRAVGYHDRTAAAQGTGWFHQIGARKRKSRQVNLWSFTNQQLIYRKYWSRQDISGKIAILVQEAKAVVFALLFERYLLRGLLMLFK